MDMERTSVRGGTAQDVHLEIGHRGKTNHTVENKYHDGVPRVLP